MTAPTVTPASAFLRLATILAEAAQLARAYRLILSWPCPNCGQPYPCPCDARETARPADTSQKGGAHDKHS